MKYWLKLWAICMGILLLTLSSTAQHRDSIRLVWKLMDEKDQSIFRKLNYKTQFQSDTALSNEVSKIIKTLHQEGFWYASVDDYIRKDSVFTCQLSIGQRSDKLYIQNGNIENRWLEKLDIQIDSSRLWSYKDLERMKKKLMEYAENHGYPFAAIELDSIHFYKNNLRAKLYMNKGVAVRFSEIRLYQDSGTTKVKISNRYLEKYLSFYPNELYNEQIVKQVRTRLRELPFVIEKRSPTVAFILDKAVLQLYLNNRPASRFDFLIGFQPSNVSTTGKTKLSVTGNVKMDLQNSFRRGERIYFEWEKLRPQSSRFDLKFQYPYLLGLPLGIDAKMDFYKKDTNFININTEIGAQYLFSATHSVKFFWGHRLTNLLNIDTNAVLRTRQLPAISDLRYNSFGVVYDHQYYDYRFNPRKGFGINFRTEGGLKKILKNRRITDLSVPEEPNKKFDYLYDTLRLNTFQFHIEGNANYFYPLGKRATLRAAYQGAFIFVPENNLYQNELYRIGGNHLLRGFDEESITASWYNVWTVEARYLLGENSYTYLFADYAYIEKRTKTNFSADHPWGFGAGFALETKIGIFAISYALGKQLNNPILIRNAKIHLGYISLFK